MTTALPTIAPLGLEAEPEICAVVDGESRVLMVTEPSACVLWVPAALSEEGLDAALERLDPVAEWRPNAFWIGWTMERRLLRDLAASPYPSLAGFILFDTEGMEIRRGRVS